MKKILTVSLFAMMAVSAANAEIASTDYVGKQITATAGTLSNLTTTEKTNLVGAINELKDGMTTMDDGYGTVIDELSSSFTSYQTSNDAAVAAAKQAGDDAQADIDAYIESNNAALALKANSADVYTKTAADAEFMNSSEVSAAIASAVTGDNGALKDYVTNDALADSQSAQDTTLKAYADSVAADAAATAKSGAEATAAAALNAYKTTNDAAVATAKKAGDDAQADLDAYKTTNAEAVAAAKKAGDDAQADIDAYIESNDAALSLKANSADVYTKTAADAEFMNSSEVSTAIANAVTGDNGALKDYVTNDALADSQSAQDTTLKAYADSAAATAKSGAEATAAAALGEYQTTNNAAVAAAKKAGDDAQATADTKQAKSTADYQLGNKDGTWTTIKSYYEGLPSYCSTGTCSLVAKEGTIQWEKVSY
ncbi:MAG: hypothetical protein E7008_02775 [Alphaproteobacteria bacterium]|nr:hypothetical protein [Alphaproteobacteria bacterium]